MLNLNGIGRVEDFDLTENVNTGNCITVAISLGVEEDTCVEILNKQVKGLQLGLEAEVIAGYHKYRGKIEGVLTAFPYSVHVRLRNYEIVE